MDTLLNDFYNLLRERFMTDIDPVERSITYTFFYVLAASNYCKPHEILLEYKHKNIPGKKVDTYIKANDERHGLVMECKYDRKIPSKNNNPRPRKAGMVFNDLFRLASFSLDSNIKKWFIYITDEEMANYYNNEKNKLVGFFNIKEGKELLINQAYLKNKCETFNSEIKNDSISEIVIKCIFDNSLPKDHIIKIFEIENVK